MPNADDALAARADLLPCETEMLRVAETGEPVYAGAGPFDLPQMAAWGRERTIRASVLRQLLVDSHVPINAKGVMLAGLRITERLDLEMATLRCPLRLRDCYFDDPEPVILDNATASLLTLHRCYLAGLTGDSLAVSKDLNLTGTVVTGLLSLRSANIGGSLICSDAQLRGTDGGYSLVADEMKAGGAVFLDGTFTAAAAVDLTAADITHNLTCRGGTLNGSNSDGNALIMDAAKVGGHVLLEEGFTAAGAVYLVDADISGSLSCVGAELTGHNRYGNALDAARMKVRYVSLDMSESAKGPRKPFTAAGAVQLADAEIAGALTATGAQLTNADPDGNALVADRVKVGSDASLVSLNAVGDIQLTGASITGLLDCRGTQLISIDGQGRSLVGNGMKSGSDVRLSEGFTAGTVQLADAVIGGALTCTGAQLNGADKDGQTLVAYRVKVSGDVSLDVWVADDHVQWSFTAAGAVQLADAVIGGALTCTGAQLNGADEYCTALAAYRVKVSGNMSLDAGPVDGKLVPFKAAGVVQLDSANVGGSLVCTCANLTAADRDGNVLSGYHLKVGSDVLLNTAADADGTARPFTAAGTVYLTDADIGGSLTCTGATLGVQGQDGYAMLAERLRAGSVSLDGWSADGGYPFTAYGPVWLRSANIAGTLVLRDAILAVNVDSTALDASGAQVGQGLQWAPSEPVAGTVNLENAQAGLLDDDWAEPGDPRAENGYWPAAAKGRLRLDGFTYTAMGQQPVSLQQRLRWIGSEPPSAGETGARWDAIARPRQVLDQLKARRAWRADRKRYDFAPQPYGQLAKIYQQAGLDTEARTMAVARRRDLRLYGHITRRHHAGNWILDKTIQYGYQTWRAVAWIAVLYAIVALLFWYGQGQSDLIVPVQSTAGLPAVPTAGTCTTYYPCFSPVGYAIDTVIPLVNVHQASSWGPNAGAPYGWLYVVVTWAGTVFGWALVTLAVAGYTGLVRNSDAL